MRNLALGIAPDFRTRALVVGKRIVGIGKLVEDQSLPVRLHLLGNVARPFHAAFLGREHEPRAECRHALAAFDRKVFGHDEDHSVTTHRRDHRQRNAGVAAGRLDQRVAGLDAAAFFSLAHHRKRRPVFHRSCGIVAFEFRQDDVARLARDALQSHEWGIAHEIVEGLADADGIAIHA